MKKSLLLSFVILSLVGLWIASFAIVYAQQPTAMADPKELEMGIPKKGANCAKFKITFKNPTNKDIYVKQCVPSWTNKKGITVDPSMTQIRVPAGGQATIECPKVCVTPDADTGEYPIDITWKYDSAEMVTDPTIILVPWAGVGGVWVTVDKFGLLAPYIGLASTIVVTAVATAIYVKRVKPRKEKQ